MTTQPTNQETLVSEIERVFAAPEDSRKYEICRHKYPAWAIEKAFRDAKAIPRERIKKSRAAIFFYLVKQYAHKIPHNSRG